MYNIFKIKKSKPENLIDELVKRSCDYLKTYTGFLNSSLEEQEPQCELPPGWKPKPQETGDYWNYRNQRKNNNLLYDSQYVGTGWL